MPSWVGCTFSYVAESAGFPPGVMYIDMFYSLEMLRGFLHTCILYVFLFSHHYIVLFAHDYMVCQVFLFQKISDR